MTNLERVKENITIEDIKRNNSAQPIMCATINKIRKEINCYGRSCSECVDWLEEEYVEPVELTEAERTILENVDKRFRYIARERNGNLCLYKDRPTKGISTWINGIITMHMGVFSHLFQFVQWEDTEPYEIAKLLEG